jgi:hypothetical protein
MTVGTVASRATVVGDHHRWNGRVELRADGREELRVEGRTELRWRGRVELRSGEWNELRRAVGRDILRIVNARQLFHTRCQEDVYRKVKSYLDELVDEHFDDAEHCDFYLKYGSTVVEISIEPFEEDDAVIEVLAFCVQGVEPSFELMNELLRLNSEVQLGAFSLVESDIYYSHSFLGRRLQPDQLIASLNTVASISDEYDEKIVQRYGGETALDRLRSTSRRVKKVPAVH